MISVKGGGSEATRREGLQGRASREDGSEEKDALGPLSVEEVPLRRLTQSPRPPPVMTEKKKLTSHGGLKARA
jgi:hypothetical protein